MSDGVLGGLPHRTVPGWMQWFILGICAGMFLMIVLLALFADGSIYAAQPCGAEVCF